ncbi:MAG: phage tail protein [Oscillospiraceae bacterium]|jgi:hypothetical protein|nr:phage tail protein [Oscillospiraceae bacterium]
MEKMRRTPYPIDSTASKGSLNDIPFGFNFIVILNNFTYGFQEVGNIEEERPCDTLVEGGNDHPVFVRKPRESQSTLTFKRGMLIKKYGIVTDIARMGAAALPINMLRKTALLTVSSFDSVAALEEGPAIGFLQVFDRQFKNDVATFSFFSLGMVSWKLSDLDAQGNGLLIEEYTIAHQGLKRLTTNFIPSFISSFIVDDDYISDSEGYISGASANSDEGLEKQEKKLLVRPKLRQEETKNEARNENLLENVDKSAEEAKQAAENARKAAMEARIAKLKEEQAELAEKNAEIAESQAEDENRRKEIQQSADKLKEEQRQKDEEIKEEQRANEEENRTVTEERRAQLESERAELAKKSKEIAEQQAEDEKRRAEIQQNAEKLREEHKKAAQEAKEKREAVAEAAQRAREAANKAEAAADDLENSTENDPEKVNSAREAAQEARDAADEADAAA